MLTLIVSYTSAVSIHVPARGTTRDSATRRRSYLCFNPRSRKGNDNDATEITVQQVVSIHVPARGTTQQDIYDLRAKQVSIHVPARGTTLALFLLSDRCEVSIHVPARGTTRTERL